MPAGTVIDTDAGNVLLGEFDDSEIILRPHGDSNVETVIRDTKVSSMRDNKDSFQLQMDDFVAACLDGSCAKVSGIEAIESLTLIDRLYESATSMPNDWLTWVGTL